MSRKNRSSLCRTLLNHERFSMKTPIIFIGTFLVSTAASDSSALAQSMSGNGLPSMGGGGGTSHPGTTGGNPTGGAMGALSNGSGSSHGGGGSNSAGLAPLEGG